MRKVTCRITGESGYSNDFYKAPNGKYYKSIYHNQVKKDTTQKVDIECYEEIDLGNIEKCIEYTNKLLKDNVKLYRVTNLLKDFAENNVLPTDYDYSKIRQILMENNLITIDSIGHTVATDYALENHLYFIDKMKVKNGAPVYNYYVSEKCRKLLLEIFSQYEDINDLRKAS